jgi:hypothetical protein
MTEAIGRVLGVSQATISEDLRNLVVTTKSKPALVRMYDGGKGMTQEAIGRVLGVSQTTISNDLADLLPANKSKPAKTATNPKGAGRHRDDARGAR